ncbi:MAG: hypothetical protein RBU30_07635 [Polyangia bacterium]|jgi:hypothetical protein|nr:hypothetical protein [Polyangia bacterium]
MADDRLERCFFCGATFPRRELIRGAGGAICRTCIAALQELGQDHLTGPPQAATEQATRAVSLEEIRRDRVPRTPATGKQPHCDDANEERLSRVGESTSMVDTMEGKEDGEIDLERGISRELSAHDYESRMDLAAAYLEMGRRHAAVRELLAALESTLLCKDYPSALRCVARVRATVDVPKVRDRICEILARHSSDD